MYAHVRMPIVVGYTIYHVIIRDEASSKHEITRPSSEWNNLPSPIPWPPVAAEMRTLERICRSCPVCHDSGCLKGEDQSDQEQDTVAYSMMLRSSSQGQGTKPQTTSRETSESGSLRTTHGWGLGWGVYVIGGGGNDYQPVSSVERLRDGQWETMPPLPTARMHASAAVLDGKIYVIGGVDVDHNILGSVLIYGASLPRAPLPDTFGLDSSLVAIQLILFIISTISFIVALGRAPPILICHAL